MEQIIREIMELIAGEMRKRIVGQGHNLTGRLANSIEYTVEKNGDYTSGLMYIEDYGVFVNVGVSASRIPYGKGGGNRGGTSAYIQGLIEFWEHRGLTGREAIGAAFATAKVHAREGMPSRSSSRFSDSGERTGFVKEAVSGISNKIEENIASKFGKTLTLEFSELFNTEKIRIA